MTKQPATRKRAPGSEARVARWIERLRQNRAVRARLEGAGRIAIDRSLPFLAVCRGSSGPEDRGVSGLLSAVAGLAVARPEKSAAARFTSLVRALTEAALADFGSMLLLEVWADDSLEGEDGTPAFEVHLGRDERTEKTAEELLAQLASIRVRDRAARVGVRRSTRWAPIGRSRVFKTSSTPAGVVHLGLALRPVYRNPANGESYPLVLRELRRQLTNALQRTFYEFACSQTNSCPRDYHMLGRRAMKKAVWEVDGQLARVADSFDFLLQVTPTNTAEAWEEFKGQAHEHNPLFLYRPAPEDPSVLRRALFAAAVEKVDDPTLDDLFRRKQAELALQIGLMAETDHRRFVLGGMQLYGEVEPALLKTARRLIKRCPEGRGVDDTTGGNVSEDELAELARAEIQLYRDEWPQFDAQVSVRDDVARGLLVSQGSVLIGRGTHVPRRRVDALLQHEVGTHVLTYHNARVQPLRLLSSGLDGYEALQEGLAVLAEYIAGGLSTARLRLLGARVVGVHAMLGGAEFVETFRLLTNDHGFEKRTAFNVATRIHRGGGLPKDAIYLRGLIQALEYVGTGGQIRPLATGKIAPEHIPLVRELQLRGVLVAPPLLPHYLRRPEAAERIARLRSGLTVLDLVDEAPF